MLISYLKEGIRKLTKKIEPITISKTEFKNRMVISAMVTNYCNEDGTPTEKFMANHEHKAKGGYGIIITDKDCGGIENTGRSLER